MKGYKRIAASLIGMVFFIAGFLKLMDPVGTGLLMESYFNFLHIPSLKPLAEGLGVVCCLVETILGAALITGVFRKVVAVVTLAVLMFFLLLTGTMWFFDAPMDCGCFGEAIHLSHVQSVIKNGILLMLWIPAFAPLRKLDLSCKKVKYGTFALASISVCAFAVYSLMSVPLMDFTPFSPGTMLFDESASEDDDAPVLSFCNTQGDYCDSLALHGKVMIFSVHSDCDAEIYDGIADCSESVVSCGVKPILLTVRSDVDGAYSADRRTLMTLNRSNGGATLLSDGQIVAKWPSRSYPTAERLSELVSEEPEEAVMDENDPRKMKVQGFLLYVFAVMLLL